jgi:hypothetical protein
MSEPRRDDDIRPMSELVRLLNHPTHPAKLELSQTKNLAYLCMWDEKEEHFFRTWNDPEYRHWYLQGFHTMFGSRTTRHGIRRAEDGSNGSAELDVALTPDELDILGDQGMLVECCVDQLLKDPQRYFGAWPKLAFLWSEPASLSLEAKRTAIRSLMAPSRQAREHAYRHKQARSRGQATAHPACRNEISLEVATHPNSNLLSVDVFSNLAQHEPSTPLYYVPVHAADEITHEEWEAFVTSLHLPSPFEVVPPASTNSQSASIVGISFHNDGTWNLCVRVMQIVRE